MSHSKLSSCNLSQGYYSENDDCDKDAAAKRGKKFVQVNFSRVKTDDILLTLQSGKWQLVYVVYLLVNCIYLRLCRRKIRS